MQEKIIAKYEESIHSVILKNKTEVNYKIRSQIRSINNYFYKFEFLSNVIKIEISWEDYGTGNRLGWCSKVFEIPFDEKSYTSVETICKGILQAVKDNQPYNLITTEEYNAELLALIIYFKENYANNFSYLNKVV